MHSSILKLRLRLLCHPRVLCETKRNETKRNGTLRNSTLRNGTLRNGTLRNGTLRNGYNTMLHHTLSRVPRIPLKAEDL